MSDNEDKEEEKFNIDEDEIIAKIVPASTKIFARSIVDGLRDELLKKEEEIIGRLEKWLVSTLIRRLIHSFIMDLDKIVQSAIEEKADEAEARVKRLIQEELRRLEDRIRREGLKEHVERPTISPVAQTYKTTTQTQTKKSIEKELAECRTKVADLNDRLGKLFNLLIKFEPRIQTLPIIEQFGEISIDDLARMINVDKNYLMEFLNATTQAGLTLIRGGKIKVLKPIFKRG
ncbi:MAG: hypothetical protein ACP6IP_02610 [Candidatus Njordarchaeia archaeon]